MDEATRARLTASIEEFLTRYSAAFETGTRDDLEQLVHLPVVYIAEDQVHVRDRYPFDPVKMRAASGFARGDVTKRIIHLEPTRAHVLIEGIRYRGDGSPIESINSVYVLQDRGDGWKVAAFSGIRADV